MAYPHDHIIAESELEVRIPMVPNFLQTSAGECQLADLSDESLQALGAAWTVKLIKRANQQRQGRTERPRDFEGSLGGQQP